MQQVTRQVLLPRVNLTQVRTDRFHTGFLSATLVTELKRSEASKNVLLCRVLRRGTALYPEAEDLSALSERLMGPEIAPFAGNVGERQLTGLEMRFSEDHFASGHPVLEGVCALMGEMLTAPDTRGGMLRPDYVLSERLRLSREVAARALSGDETAMDRLTELCCQGERYAGMPTGDEKMPLTVGHTGLSKHFRRVQPTADIELFYCGSAPEDRVAGLLAQALADLPREEGKCRPTLTTVPKNRSPVGGSGTGFGPVPKTAVCFRIAGGLTGQSAPILWLIRSLMEALLPEVTASRGDEEKGILLLCASDTDGESFPARAKAAMEIIAKGLVPPEVFRSAGETLLFTMQRWEDDPAELGRKMTRFALLKLPCTPGEFGALCVAVTPEEAADAAENMIFCGTYTLTGEGASPCE